MEAQDRREHRDRAPGTPGRASVGLVRSVPIRLAQTPTTYWVRAEPHRDRPINRGGVLQEENLETAAVGLAPMYPAYLWSD